MRSQIRRDIPLLKAYVVCSTIALAALGTAVNGQEIEIGIIDLYGLGRVPTRQVREMLTFTEGDTVNLGGGKPAFLQESEDRLARSSEIDRARTQLVCCDEGRVIVYVGIEERGAATMRFRAEPAGDARLAADVVRAGDEVANALRLAILRGDAGEDWSRGHALADDPAVRAIQERFLLYAARDLPALRLVLRNSSDAAHRALAALVLGYVADKPAVVEDLVHAMSDPSAEVRNNAMRALLVFAEMAPGGQLVRPARARPTVHRVAALAGMVGPEQGVLGAGGPVRASGSRPSRGAAGTGAPTAHRDGAVDERGARPARVPYSWPHCRLFR